MKLIQVYADTVGRARCSGPTCGAAITWATVVASGRKLCFDGELVALKTSMDADHRQIWEVSGDDMHWATCLDVERFRR